MKINQVHDVRLLIIMKIIEKVVTQREIMAVFSLALLFSKPSKNTPKSPPKVNEEIPSANSTNAFEEFINKKDETTRMEVQPILRTRITAD